MTLLCDTNIISELCKPQPDPGVIAWSAEVTTIADQRHHPGRNYLRTERQAKRPNSGLVSRIFENVLSGAPNYLRDCSMRG
jgi:hypothetical protein